MSTPTPPPPPAARAVTVDELCDHLSSLNRPDGALLCDFARVFFAKVPASLLEERGVEQLGALTLGAWEFLRASRPDRVNVQVVEPDEEGWSAPVTVLRAQVGDRPFVVDSIRECLAAEEVPVQHYVYPVLRVRRDASGEVVAVGDEAGDSLETLSHVEIARVADPARREEVRAGVQRALEDVVAATRDFPRMQEALQESARLAEEYRARFPRRSGEFGEMAEFLRWLGQGNFVFLGYREYAVEGADETATVHVRAGSGLGILGDTATSSYSQPVPVSTLSPDLRARVLGGPTLIVSKTTSESTVHRRDRMDYVGVKLLDDRGQVTGERRFLGLFTSQAYAAPASDIPILRHKLDRILENSGGRPGSHDYKEIVSIVNGMPKEELFEASVEQLEDEVRAALASLFSEEVRVSVHAERLRSEAAVMVILPRGKFSTANRDAIGELVAQRVGGEVVDYDVSMDAGDRARVHYYLSHPEGAALPEPRELEVAVSALVRSWQDRLEERLRDGIDGDEAHRLALAYAEAFSPEYRAAVAPSAAVHDLLRLERMRAEGDTVALTLRQPLADEAVPPGATVLKLYLRGERLVLSDFMPLLEDHAVRVIDMDSFEASVADGDPVRVYSFNVQTREGQPIASDATERLAESLLATRAGDAPRDPFNALVLVAGMRWREADLLRTYANYASQIGAVPSRLAPVRALTT
ncbi:MAG TPA: hypothetical protein VNP72_03650, partial [Longimicrobium sp.]|nr:hypothetical protein [Longimicrobium sp.]